MTSGISPTLQMNETILSKKKNGEEVYALGFGRFPLPIPNILNLYTRDNLCQYLLGKLGIALFAGTSFGRDASEYSARLAFVDFDGRSALSKIENYSDHTLFVNEVCPRIKESINQIKHFLII